MLKNTQWVRARGDSVPGDIHAQWVFVAAQITAVTGDGHGAAMLWNSTRRVVAAIRQSMQSNANREHLEAKAKIRFSDA